VSTRPRVTLKLATSLDGRIATASGESQWITGARARAAGHDLRGVHAAILVGSGTALKDDPELTARGPEPPAEQPLRIVLDTKLRLPPDAQLLKTVAFGPVLIAAGGNADGKAKAKLEAMGARVWLCPHSVEGVDLPSLLNRLKSELATESLLVEGGGIVASSFLAHDLVDRIEWFRAPLILGAEGRPGVGLLGIEKLAQASRWRRVAARPLEEDLWETYERAT
jgi:diaminohydroxyphosphoribosylaminopyrimidine deaminase/5-amino-6-(5-phosphoribosylamino)uracil reductase